jgi:glycerol-3-phosphate dehydrogenase (NAD(P)+)
MSSDNKKHAVAVLGAGSWGTALALLLARNGHTVLLWGNDAVQQARLERERLNSVYLPGICFPENLHARDSLSEAAKSCSRFLLAVPSHGFRATLAALQPLLPEDAVLAWATKGLEPGSGKLLSQVAAEVLAGRGSLAVISGPTFAREVALNLPSALTVASEQEMAAEEVASWLRNDRVRVYTSRDVAGVQLGGAIKNVMAIAAGISDGLGFGANARAALITRGLAELTRLGVAMGGQKETFMGLTGAGDLILTCTDNASRNRRVGLALGQGRKLPGILADLGQEAEGVATARELYQLAKKLHVEMPITEQVYRVLYEDLPPQAAVEALLRREPRSE